MQYFSDVFTKETWSAFLSGNRQVTAFSSAMERKALAVAPGDRLLCYVRRQFEFVGALEVTSSLYRSDSPIWGTTDWPIRMNVEPRVAFPLGMGIPLTAFESRLSIYPAGADRATVPPHFQGSPRLMRESDGETLWRALLAADDGVNAVEAPEARAEQIESRSDEHYEMQALLAAFGAHMGLGVWVPPGDRGRVLRQAGAPAPTAFVPRLPAVFGGLGGRGVESIDVLWLEGSRVVAAFEVEHSTAIYSGLLRMADLVALIPDLPVDLFVVADASRLPRWRAELNRPAFERLGLPQRCYFLPYEQVRTAANLGDHVLANLRRDYFRAVATPLRV